MEAKTAKNKTLKTRDLTLTALFAALIAICAWLTIPMPDVPFTMQTFGIFITLLLLGGERGTLAILLYILLGAVGLPVFSGFRGGIASLLGTTGGYIVGFLFSGLSYWAIMSLIRKEHPAIRFLALTAALFVCYAFGTAWFMVMYLRSSGPISLGLVLMKCVVPYLIPDFVKMLVAVSAANAVKKRVKL